ncbi:hypothetical protein AVEN_203006-1 [Araneus ventricosus]|uniref:Uncharacterized protein n=1 Tax=Araneus ventricosus TaxID=182803 RepID=A0A4Y2EQ28_ARAVE|nr:hypothetical protein AVEN_203006-1 [Araneus ventricosus]
MSLQQPNWLDGHGTIQHMIDRANNWTTKTASGAMVLLRRIDYEFVCLLEMWSEVLVKLDYTNKSLFLPGKALNESSVSYFEKCAADFGAKYNKDVDTDVV